MGKKIGIKSHDLFHTIMTFVVIGLTVVLLFSYINALFGNEVINPLYKQKLASFIKENRVIAFDHTADINIISLKKSIKVDASKISFITLNSSYAMEPYIDGGRTAFFMIPRSEYDLELQDIVSYVSEPQFGSNFIISRIIKTDKDDIGWYAIMKADNKEQPEPSRVRFNQIKHLILGVIEE